MNETLPVLLENAVVMLNRLNDLYHRLFEMIEIHTMSGKPLPAAAQQISRVAALYRAQSALCARLSAQVEAENRRAEQHQQKQARHSAVRPAPAPAAPVTAASSQPAPQANLQTNPQVKPAPAGPSAAQATKPPAAFVSPAQAAAAHIAAPPLDRPIRNHAEAQASLRELAKLLGTELPDLPAQQRR